MQRGWGCVLRSAVSVAGTRLAVCPVHVGRDAEFERLADALQGARETGRFVLVAGEPGLGKTRLVREVLRAAEAAGTVRLTGQCTPDAGVPYEPFVTALRRRVRTMDPDVIGPLFEGPALLTAVLLPEISAHVALPSGLQPMAADLFAAVWHSLRRLVPNGGVLVLEDLHWADGETLRLLTYLARELTDLPLLVLGTYRPDELHRRHPWTIALADLTRERLVEEVRLRPLDREDVRAMLTAIFDGTPVGDEFAEAVLERTGGNPFFVEELLKVLVERGDIYREGDEWSRRQLADIELPATVRETLLARADELPEEGMRVLCLAGIGGDALDLPVLARAAELDRAAVDDVVAAGLRLQLLVESHDGAEGGYRFRHALTREAFADELVGPARRRARAALAAAIAEVHADDLDSYAGELTEHHLAAGNRAAAAEFAVLAARQAVASGAPRQAAGRYETALSLSDAVPAERLQLILEAADGTFDEVDHRLQRAFAEEALALARNLGDTTGEARAFRHLRMIQWWDGDGPGAIDMCYRFIDRVAGRDDWAHADVLAGLTRSLVLGDRMEEATPLLSLGEQLAERSANGWALGTLAGTRLLVAPRGPEFEDAVRTAVETSRAAGSWRGLTVALTNAGYICLWQGDLSRARELLLEAQAESRRLLAVTSAYTDAGLAWAEALMGHYDQMTGILDRIRASSAPPTRVVALTAAAEAAHRRGDPTEVALVEELLSVAATTGEAQRSVPALAAQARMLLKSAGLQAAAETFWAALAATRTISRGGSHWAFSPEYAAALAAEGRADELGRWLAELRVMTANDAHPHNRAALLLSEGHLSALSGEAAGARREFAESAEMYRAMPCPAREVEALLGVASAAAADGGPDEAVAVGSQARDVAERIGASALADSARGLLARVAATPVLATVLFTDMVGSTERAAAVGDRAWRDLVELHHRLVRREIGRFGGREIDTAGDGFLVSFDSPAQAIRCARAIRDALTESHLPVRAGIHTGECQQVGDKLTGLAVHIAARVSATATAGEVLVSGTVRELVTGSGITFEDRGLHPLKGVPGEWRLFAVSG
jgi:class 3 adenylate cyclase/RecA/RadA recombinase